MKYLQRLSMLWKICINWVTSQGILFHSSHKNSPSNFIHIVILAYEALIHIFNDPSEFFKSQKHKTKAIMWLLIFIVELSINGMLCSSKCFWFGNLQQ